MTPRAAMEVVLGLPPIHVITVPEARGAWSGIQTVQRPMKSLVLGCKMGVKKEAYSSVLGFTP